MKIVICDDEKNNISELKKYIPRMVDTRIYEYTSPEALLESEESFDIAFLDIEMNEYSGFDIAEHIYNKNSDCIISFYSNHAQYALKGYRYHIYRYILKDEPEPIKKETINEIFEEYGRRFKTAEISSGNERISIRLRDIYYIESLRKKMSIHLSDKEVSSSSPLKSFETNYAQYGFVRIHKSYVVNTDRISSVVSGRELTLENGVILPIGRKYSEGLKRSMRII